MKYATICRPGGRTSAVRIDGPNAVVLAAGDVGILLSRTGEGSMERGPLATDEDLAFAPLVPAPTKVICVGLNYRSHLHEMGRPVPRYPALFAKFADALTGVGGCLHLPTESIQAGWEAELAVVVGTTVKRANADEAAAAIAGFAILNDVTMRDWQWRTSQWLQGKTFEGTAPFGPYLVTPDELPSGVCPQLTIRCLIDGEVVQEAETSDLIFDAVTSIEYVSNIVPLAPGI